MKISAFLSLAVFSGIGQAETDDSKIIENQQALDEDFLLFLANTTNDQDQMIDQLDMLDLKNSELDKLINENDQDKSQDKERTSEPMKNITPQTLAKENIE